MAYTLAQKEAVSLGASATSLLGEGHLPIRKQWEEETIADEKSNPGRGKGQSKS